MTIVALLQWAYGGIEEHIEMPAGKKATFFGEYKAVKLLLEESAVEFKSSNGKTEIIPPQSADMQCLNCQNKRYIKEI